MILYDREKGIHFKDLNSDSSTSHGYRLGFGASESLFFQLYRFIAWQHNIKYDSLYKVYNTESETP